MKELSSYPNPTTKQNISTEWNVHPPLHPPTPSAPPWIQIFRKSIWHFMKPVKMCCLSWSNVFTLLT